MAKVRLTDGRALALEALLRSEAHDSWSNRTIDALLSSEASRLENRERRLGVALFYQTVTRLVTIDWYLSQLSKKPLDQLDAVVRNSLRLGLVQILYFERIPERAAVNESCRLVGERLHKGAVGFTNGVLRQFLRRRPEIPDDNPSVCFSASPMLVRRLTDWLGADDAAAYLEQTLQELPLSIRITETGKRAPGGTAAIVERLNLRPGQLLDDAWILELGDARLTSLADWQAGHIYVQGEGAQCPIAWSGITANDRVVDLCAAPGGKSLQAAERCGPGGRVQAVDIHEGKLELIRENAARLQLENIDLMVADATTLTGELKGLTAKADVVIADVPCTGLGLLARRPELRLSDNALSDDELDRLYREQAAILRTAAALTRPGGTLVYSTCTINPHENEGQIRSWLLDGADGHWQLTDLSAYLPAGWTGSDRLLYDMRRGSVTLGPPVTETEGFYIAVLKRAP